MNSEHEKALAYDPDYTRCCNQFSKSLKELADDVLKMLAKDLRGIDLKMKNQPLLKKKFVKNLKILFSFS